MDNLTTPEITSETPGLDDSLELEFSEMVTRLFKTTDMHHDMDGLMHAAIGLCSELAELHKAIDNQDRPNLIEELGDLEFYLEALDQRAGLDLKNNAMVFMSGDDFDFLVLALECSKILDLSKKCWVYGRVLDMYRDKIMESAVRVAAELDKCHFMYEVSFYAVIKTNMEKLQGAKGRYKDGQYSDTQAQERADKQGAED